MDRGGGEAYVPSRRIALESGEVTNGDFHMESVRIKVQAKLHTQYGERCRAS